MAAKTLTIIESTPTAQGAFLINAVLTHWPSDERPEVVNLQMSQVLKDESALDKIGVAWVLMDQFGAAHFSSLAARLQERDVPIMLSRAHEIASLGSPYHTGIIIGPPTAPSVALCGMLRALWGQNDMVEHFKSEIKYLRAHQGGLCDQFGKIDEELRLAAQLQREFLPRQLPTCDELNFQVLFRPATYVSGDIYDIERLDEEHIGFFLADAVGHGVPAALMTMYIKRSLRTKEIAEGSGRGYRIIPPAEALASLNVDLSNQPTEQVRFATAVYGVINTTTLEVEVARAGHPFPLLLRQEDEPQWIEADGAMLGIFPEEVFETQRFQMRPGDRLLFYSDGFELAFPEGSADQDNPALANQRYMQEFIELRRTPLEQTIEMLAQRLDQQAGSLNQQDDLTALVIGVRAKAVAARVQPVQRAAG